MKKIKNQIFISGALLIMVFLPYLSSAQRTQIRGFVDVLSSYQNNKVNFGLGEQDLFITSELSSRLSFLGESVFRYSPNSPTTFDVSIERIVLKYNYFGNHNILAGKHHTPINYWNDTYHHGRVFFPTIERPLIFSSQFIPLHTTGVSLQGQNLGELKFGYDLMVGNGLGSGEIVDNDKYKSVTAAVHIKPYEGLRIGASYYRDVISKGATIHDHGSDWKVIHGLTTLSVAYFGRKYEVLAEGTLAKNRTDTTGVRTSTGSYAYFGIRATEKLVPYIRFDNISYQPGEVYFHKNNATSYVGGFRYEINYLAVVKLEYQREQRELSGFSGKVIAQFAIGF